MSLFEIERILKRMGATAIDNSTQIGTFAIVEAEKFITKSISNRDNARWKRAQFIVVEYSTPLNIPVCLKGFLQFAERCQFLIIANTNQVYNGDGRAIDMSQIKINE